MMKKILSILLHPAWLSRVLAAYAAWVEPAINRAWGVALASRAGRFPATSRIHGRILLLHPRGLVVGDHVRIGTGCILHCGGGVEIGDNTQISRNVVIYSCNHNHKGEAIPYDTTYLPKPVAIGRSVWIGVGAHIRPGVSIGDGAIVGMGCVVTRDVAPGEIVVSPAHVLLGTRDLARFAELDSQGRHFGALWPEN